MLSPYITTKLFSIVTIHPYQMNNDIYMYMKNNLKERLEGKCYRNYGCVVKIYKILEYMDGIVEPENPTAASTYKVKFSCKLCMPIKNRNIICRVEKTNPMLTSLSNGPIRVIITNDRINKDNFTISKTGIVIRSGNRPLRPGDYVKVKIDSRKFNDKDTIIMCMGILEEYASDEEQQQYISEQKHDDNEEDLSVDYYKFVEQEK